ncbi:MAG TPA: histidine kinase N-terminal 7TM domain-containing protein [Polyangia bacterium]|nr:histidine kinase N-terminal 7TM domain-containing protein [Polyangia bacterium]
MGYWLGPLTASLVVSLATALFAFQRRKHTPAARAFALVPLSHAVWTTLQIAVLASRSLQAKLLFTGGKWLAGLGIVAGTLWFAHDYSGRKFRLSVWGWLLVLPLPLIGILMVEPLTHHVHPDAWIAWAHNPPSLEYSWRWPEVGLIAYGCVMFTVAGGLVVHRLSMQNPAYIEQGLIVLIGLALPPAAALVALALGLRSYDQRDPTPLVFGTADLIVAFGLFRRRLFDLAPLALEAVVKGLTDGVVVCDDAGRIVDHNPAFGRMLDLGPASLVGRPAAAALAAWPALVDACAGKNPRNEMVLDGVEPRWLDLSSTAVDGRRGTPMGRVIVLRDVTASHRANQRRFEAVFEHAFELIALLDAEGRVLEVNSAALAFVNIERHEVLGKPLWDTPWWAHYSTERDKLKAAISAVREGQFARFESANLRCDLHSRYFDFSLTPVRDDGGKIEYLLAEGRDVTEHLRAEKQKAVLIDELAHARRLDSVGRMAGGIAHDFNNLLVAIMGSTEVIRDSIPQGSPGDKAVRVIEQAAHSASRLTRQLLAFGRPSTVRRRLTDVAMAIERSARLIRPILGGRIELEVRPGPALWPITVDAGQLEQVLLNLAINARDAMPAGGRLTISAENITLAECRRFRGAEAKDGEYLQIRVSDSGDGMSESALDHLFEPFFTTKSPGRGSGLGLSVVHGIVRGSGGYIEVQSQPGAGTELRLLFPRGDLAEALPDAPPPGVGDQAHRRVLVVEDQQPVRSFVRDRLTELGYEVYTCPDRAAVEKAAATLPVSPDLLITEFVLPGLSGPEVADLFRRRWPALKILFLSGMSADAVHGTQQRRPGICVLPTPFEASALTEAVRGLLGAEGAHAQATGHAGD